MLPSTLSGNAWNSNLMASPHWIQLGKESQPVGRRKMIYTGNQILHLFAALSF